MRFEVLMVEEKGAPGEVQRARSHGFIEAADGQAALLAAAHKVKPQDGWWLAVRPVEDSPSDG